MTKRKRPWYRRTAVVAVLSWVLLILAFWVASSLLGQSPPELLADSLQLLAASPYAAFWLVLVYLVRPFLLLPVTVLTVFSGFLFGPVLGGLYALIASLVSSYSVFALARLLVSRSGRPNLAAGGRFARQLQQQGFETVLTARLAFVPGDLINYLSGALGVRLSEFLLATLIGGTPGLLMGVLAGTSIRGEFEFSGLRINWYYLAGSVALLLVSLLVANWLRRRGYGLRK